MLSSCSQLRVSTGESKLSFWKSGVVGQRGWKDDGINEHTRPTWLYDQSFGKTSKSFFDKTKVW